MKLLIAFVFGALTVANAAYFASPSATSGDGSIDNPWNLNIALTNSALLSGGILYLRGGSYHGHFRSTLNNATVRSYPGEWAIIDDGQLVTVAVSANSTTNKLALTGSEWFQSAQVLVLSTGEHVQLSSAANGTNWTVTRGWNGTTAKTQPQGTIGCLQDYIINHGLGGSNTTFRDFEITSLLSTNRVVGTNWWIGGGLNLDVGVSNNAINLVIHDTGHPGIGFWDQNGGVLYGNIIWGVGMYDYSPDYAGGVGTPRGSCVYAQNSGNMSIIANCIHFRNFTSGGKVYGETGPVLNFGFFTNIVYQCDPTIEGSSGSTSTSNLWFDGNVTLGTPSMSYVSLSNRSTFFINNIVANGSISLDETAYSFVTNNYALTPTNAGALEAPFHYHSTHYPTNALNVTWDYNTIRLGDGSSASQFTFKSLDWTSTTNSSGGGILSFFDNGKGWTNWSLFDKHSTYVTGWDSTYQQIKVFPNAYDANRWHVAVVSTANTNTAWLDLSACGIGANKLVTVRRADVWSTPWTNFTYSGSGLLPLPLMLTNITSAKGSVTNIVDESSNVANPGLFNAFVITMDSASVIGATTANMGTVIIR